MTFSVGGETVFLQLKHNLPGSPNYSLIVAKNFSGLVSFFPDGLHKFSYQTLVHPPPMSYTMTRIFDTGWYGRKEIFRMIKKYHWCSIGSYRKEGLGGRGCAGQVGA